MSPRSAFTAAVLLVTMAAVPARAQDPPSAPEQQEPAPAQVVERTRGGERRDSGAVSVRAPRVNEDNGAQEVRPRVRPAIEPPAPAASAPTMDEQQGGRRRSGGGGQTRGGGGRSAGGDGAQPRGGVRAPRGGRGDEGNGGPHVGQAVPRTRAQRPGQTYYAPSYSRRYYAGAGGLGYYFYDPWSWYAGYGGPGYSAFGWNGYYGNNWGGYDGGGYGAGFGGGYGAYGGPFGWNIGGVRMKVEPKDAEVYVDGYYAGIVDDFDGVWQQLRLDEGGYRIEVRKAGMATLTFDVMVQPGRTITYRGRMQP